MGFTPDQVGLMSLYQFAACVDGVNDANNPDGVPEPPTDEEFRAAQEKHADK